MDKELEVAGEVDTAWNLDKLFMLELEVETENQEPEKVEEKGEKGE